MSKDIRSKKLKKIIYILFLFLLIILALLYVYQKFNLHDKIFPIYKVEARSENIKKAKKKYKNEKVLGWIRVQGTNIDYPVVRMGDDTMNTFRDTGEYAWINVDTKKIDNFVTVLGHNIRNVSSKPIIGDKKMSQFEQLMSYIYYEFNEDNKYIQFSYNGKDYLYQIFAVSLVYEEDVDSYVTSYSKEEIKNYIKKVQDESLFDYDIEVSENDKLISLITCTRFDGYQFQEFRIDAKLVNEENGYNYDVTKTDRYKEIETKLKGVDQDGYA